MNTLTRLLNDKTHSDIYEQQVRPYIFSAVTKTAEPHLILIGGQPAAGKTKASRHAQDYLAEKGYGAAIINGDELRVFHPQYANLIKQNKATAAEKTGLDVGLWVERAIREAADKKFNVVVETTLRQPDKVKQTISEFLTKGFNSELHVLIVNKEYSALSIYHRFAAALQIPNSAPRFTPERFHEDAYQQMPHSIEIASPLLDRIVFLNRENKILYDSRKSTVKPVQALFALRKQNLSPKEQAEIAFEWTQLRKALDQKGIPTQIRAGVRQEQARSLIAVKFSEKAQQELANIERKSIPPSLTKPRKR